MWTVFHSHNNNKILSGSSEQQAISRTTTVVLAIFFLSLLGIGMGRTAVETLGIPYMDDNVANRESPTYFGIIVCLLKDFSLMSLT